ncbi:hypothetical protein ASD99_24565 [Mesorhizobium sp. Root695]|nr:hypothetical protein ASD99_24565 [Mesorhizobium sp. Root695]
MVPPEKKNIEGVSRFHQLLANVYQRSRREICDRVDVHRHQPPSIDPDRYLPVVVIDPSSETANVDLQAGLRFLWCVDEL